MDVDLARWFVGEDDRVRNLAEWDYARTGTLLEFRIEIERGFTDHRWTTDDTTRWTRSAFTDPWRR